VHTGSVSKCKRTETVSEKYIYGNAGCQLALPLARRRARWCVTSALIIAWTSFSLQTHSWLRCATGRGQHDGRGRSSNRDAWSESDGRDPMTRASAVDAEAWMATQPAALSLLNFAGVFRTESGTLQNVQQTLAILGILTSMESANKSDGEHYDV